MSAEEAADYREAKSLDFPILASAKTTRELWGVHMIWGNVIRLVDPAGVVRAESLGAAERVLSER